MIVMITLTFKAWTSGSWVLVLPLLPLNVEGGTVLIPPDGIHPLLILDGSLIYNDIMNTCLPTGYLALKR